VSVQCGVDRWSGRLERNFQAMVSHAGRSGRTYFGAFGGDGQRWVAISRSVSIRWIAINAVVGWPVSGVEAGREAGNRDQCPLMRIGGYPSVAQHGPLRTRFGAASLEADFRRV